jgi:hypothetical protein
MLLKVANNPSLSRQAALGVLDQAGDGDEIKSQFFSHCWIVWPEREKRAKNKITRMERATQEREPWQ